MSIPRAESFLKATSAQLPLQPVGVDPLSAATPSFACHRPAALFRAQLLPKDFDGTLHQLRAAGYTGKWRLRAT
jgi:hypothetical protein